MYFRIVNRDTGGQVNLIRSVDSERQGDSQERRDERRRAVATDFLERWSRQPQFAGANLAIEEVQELRK